MYTNRVFKHYPRLSIVALTYALAFAIFGAIGPDTAHALVEPFGLGGIIVAGALYTYGFTASIGAVLLVALAPDYSPITLALLGGVGATIADLTLYRFFKGSLHLEIGRIAKIPMVSVIVKSPLLRRKKIRNILGFLVIASPLPDEIGIALISLTRMNESTFRIVDFAANVVGIYLLATLGGLIY